MDIRDGKNGGEPTIRVASTHDWGARLEKEFEDHSERCFVRVAAEFALGKITLQEYLDAILGHLKQGYAKHKYDVKYWYDGDDITNYMEWDLFAGAVKARSAGIDPSFDGMPDKGKPERFSLEAQAHLPGRLAHSEASCRALLDFKLPCRARPRAREANWWIAGL